MKPLDVASLHAVPDPLTIAQLERYYAAKAAAMAYVDRHDLDDEWNPAK